MRPQLWSILPIYALVVFAWTPQVKPEDPGNRADVADPREFLADSSDEAGQCLAECLAEYANLEPGKCVEDYRGHTRYCMFQCADADHKRMRTTDVNWLRWIEFVPYWDCHYSCWGERRKCDLAGWYYVPDEDYGKKCHEDCKRLLPQSIISPTSHEQASRPDEHRRNQSGGAARAVSQQMENAVGNLGGFMQTVGYQLAPVTKGLDPFHRGRGSAGFRWRMVP